MQSNTKTEVHRETPSTHISIPLLFPAAYELRASSSYHGLLNSSVCSPYLNFPIDSLYHFPLIDGQTGSNDVHALIASNLLASTRDLDINSLLETLHYNSPFKKSLHFTRVPCSEVSNLCSDLENDSKDLLNDSYLQDSESILSDISRKDVRTIDEKDKNAILHLLRGFYSKPGNENQLNSLTPVSSSIFSSQHSSSSLSEIDARSISSQNKHSSLTEDFCTSLAEEGPIQAIKFTLEVEALASKNLLASHHPKPELVKLSQKILTSMNSPFTSLVQEVSYYHSSSPILRKLVFCQHVGPESLEIVASLGTTGFLTAVCLEYSNIDIQNKAGVDYAKGETFLITSPIARALATNSAMWLSCGFEHCAILTCNGRLMTWGYGASGCLGHGNTNSYGFPKLVESTADQQFRYIECGGYHSLAITEASELFMWGRDDVHQLGLPQDQLFKDDHGYVALQPIKLEHFCKKIKGGACGEAHTLVLDEDGSIYTFGWGEDGQLGVVPAEVEGVKYKGITQVEFTFSTAIVKVAAGLVFSACLTESGEVYVWGNADKGQFGKEIEWEFVCLPQKVEVEHVIDIVCGESRVVCLCENGTVYGWGLGKAGLFTSKTFNFVQGSELVCYSPKALGEVDIIHHFLI